MVNRLFVTKICGGDKNIGVRCKVNLTELVHLIIVNALESSFCVSYQIPWLTMWMSRYLSYCKGKIRNLYFGPPYQLTRTWLHSKARHRWRLKVNCSDIQSADRNKSRRSRLPSHDIIRWGHKRENNEWLTWQALMFWYGHGSIYD